MRCQRWLTFPSRCARGQALGIVGRSGSGKSSIAGAVLNLLGETACVEGRILFDGTGPCTGPAAGRAPRDPGTPYRIGLPARDPFTALKSGDSRRRRANR